MIDGSIPFGAMGSVNNAEGRLKTSQSFIRNRYPSIHQSAIETILRSVGENHHLLTNKIGGAGIFTDYFQNSHQFADHSIHSQSYKFPPIKRKMYSEEEKEDKSNQFRFN